MLLTGFVLAAALLTTTVVAVLEEALRGGWAMDATPGVFVVDLLFPWDSTAPDFPGVTSAGSCAAGIVVDAAAAAVAAATLASASASSAAARSANAFLDLLGRFALLLALIASLVTGLACVDGDSELAGLCSVAFLPFDTGGCAGAGTGVVTAAVTLGAAVG